MSTISARTPTQITITPPPREEWKGPVRPVDAAIKALPGASDQPLLGENGVVNFADILDVINPLQHIPIVSTIYRAVTGDQISAGARLVGNALLGGVAGFAAGLIDVASEAATGKDIGQTVLAALTGKNTETAVASAATAANESTPSTAGKRAASLAPLPGLNQTSLIGDAAQDALANTAIPAASDQAEEEARTRALNAAQLRQLATYRNVQALA